MATDEKYLDDLLKSLTENEQQSGTMDDVMNDVEQTTQSEKNDADFNVDELASLLEEAFPSEEGTSKEKDLIKEADALTDLFDETLQSETVEPVAEESYEKSGEFADLFAETFPPSDNEASGAKEDASPKEVEDWQSSLDDLLAQADAQLKEDSDPTLQNQESIDTDLAEISGLLNKEDDNKAVEDDMLALLESVNDDHIGDSNGGETFDIFAENVVDENLNTSEHEEEDAGEKPQKRKLFSRGKSDKSEKKNKEQKKLRKQKKSESDLDTGDSVDGTVIGEESEELQETVEVKEKSGFFSKMITYLTQEEDDLTNASDENAEILKELNEEDQKKGKKKEKKKKKAENKKEKEKTEAEATPEGEADGAAEADTDEKKKKKEKKKKEKPPKDEVKEKPVRVLSKRNLIVLIAACATIIAVICVLSTFLTEYADKQNARQAFYEGNYEEAYRLLYDKNLNSNDSVIYNRVKIVLTIERKLDSYENNLAMNKELEALDALMQGISCYQELEGVDTYGVRSEVDAIYQQVCSILQDNYGITLEEALEINTYDNDTYTRKLNSVINGTEFIMPGEEVPQEELTPQDILPEEEEIISY